MLMHKLQKFQKKADGLYLMTSPLSCLRFSPNPHFVAKSLWVCDEITNSNVNPNPTAQIQNLTQTLMIV